MARRLERRMQMRARTRLDPFRIRLQKLRESRKRNEIIGKKLAIQMRTSLISESKKWWGQESGLPGKTRGLIKERSPVFRRVHG